MDGRSWPARRTVIPARGDIDAAAVSVARERLGLALIDVAPFGEDVGDG